MAYEYGPLSRPLKETLAALQEGLTQEYRLEFLLTHRRSARRSRRLRRIRGWIRETDHLVVQIDRVARQTIPRIEQETGHTFHGPDGLARILMDPSTKRLFSGVLAGFPEEALPVPAVDLALLGNLSDDARALGLIADVTLRLKVLSGLHVPREDVAALCDRWRLHESRITLRGNPRRAAGTSAREKETLARAVLGLIYIEGGTEALGRAAPLLACNQER